MRSVISLTGLNTDVADKSVRRNSPSRKDSKKKDAKAADALQEKRVTIEHKFVEPKAKRNRVDRLERALQLLNGEDIKSDEERNFSVSKKRKEVSEELLNKLLSTDNSSDEEK
jgi:hypothetical protein